MKRVKLEVAPFQGRWKISKGGKSFWTRDTQTLAIEAARDVAGMIVYQGGCVSLVIKRPDGTIREERTYPRSSDPRRTKG